MAEKRVKKGAKAKSKSGFSTPVVILLNIASVVAVAVVLLAAAHYSLRIITRSSQRIEVPSFEGLSLDQARKVAKENRLQLYINDSLHLENKAKGSVLGQKPLAGVEVKPNRTIYVVINAFGDRLVKMPYVAGLSLRQAINTLETSTFGVEKLIYRQDIATNYILSQSYSDRNVERGSDMLARAGSGVVLTVGADMRKTPNVAVPQVVGRSLQAAKSLLWESGLNVGSVSYADGFDSGDSSKGVVVSQSRYENQRCFWGTAVDLTVGAPSKE